MFKEIVINAEPLETRVALLEDGRLEEFSIERKSTERLVGSIYKGRIRNLEDGLKAAFVDIGFEKNAFLHYWDIIPESESLAQRVELIDEDGGKREETPRITTKDIPRLYPVGSEVIVQVSKGPIGTKGPRVTTNIALAGRYLVLMPRSPHKGISRKIEDPRERDRLKKILRRLSVPEHMGLIIRTVGEGQQLRYFVRDLHMLLEQWKSIEDNIKNSPTPSCVFQEPDLVERTVRDFLTEDIDRIVVDNKAEYARIKDIVGQISLREQNKVKLYDEPVPIFDKFSIEQQVESAFRRQVTLDSGGYIVIDETEALVAIDVNTGRHKGGRDPEDTIFRVNMEAVDEIARQLRLRNIGGLIVIDFIDMRSRSHRNQLLRKMQDALRRDKAKTRVYFMSPLGLMEMTRQRQTESMAAAVYIDCPYCKGKGKVKSALTMSVAIQRKIAEVLSRMTASGHREEDIQLRVFVNPEILNRLRTEDEAVLIDIEQRHKCKLTFRADPAFHLEQFTIVDQATGQELAKS
jgi:ribonuclease G